MVKALKADILYTGKPDVVLRDVYLVRDEDTIVGVSKEKPREAEEIIEFDKAVATLLSLTYIAI